MNLLNMAGLPFHLDHSNRPIRLHLSDPNERLDNSLIVKHVSGRETLCGGIEYWVRCVSTQAGLPLKQCIALPVQLEFVTDRGGLRFVCGIVAQASAGQGGGGLATYQLVVRDALALMALRINTRVFRDMNEVEISTALVREWRGTNPVLADVFDIDTSGITRSCPARALTMQHNESDAAFLRRLWKRRGIASFIRHGGTSESGNPVTAQHKLVLFDAPHSLKQSAAGTVRFHRDAATEARDGIFNWAAVRSLIPGNTTR